MKIFAPNLIKWWNINSQGDTWVSDQAFDNATAVIE